MAMEDDQLPSLAPPPPPLLPFPFPLPSASQFLAFRAQLPPTTLHSPGAAAAATDIHSIHHPHVLPPLHAMPVSEAGDAVLDSRSSPALAAGMQFPSRKLYPAPGDAQTCYYSSYPAISSPIPAASAAPPGSQLFSESPESSLLDPQTSPQASRQQGIIVSNEYSCRMRPEQEPFGGFSEAGGGNSSQAGRGGVYPLPLASHEEVLEDKQLFYDTFFRFHAVFDAQLTIPKVGDKDLDLHLLYSEVTAHGGLEQVVKFQKWKNIILALDLPTIISSPSFFLRKHYSKLLHHYEQVYFFKIQGELVSPPGPLPSPSLIFPLLDNESRGFQAVEKLEAVKKRRRRRRKLDSMEIVGVDPAESIGQTVTGAIEEKFEHGYLVTVVVGSEKLRGVLYHVPASNTAAQFASVPDFMSQIGSPLKASDLPFGGILRKKRRPRLISKKDPNAPRLNRSGYNFFFAEQRSQLKDYHPEKHTDVTKIIGERWHGLTMEERMPYLQRGKKDKERYQKEKGEYLDKIQPQLRNEYVGKAFSLLLKDPGNDEPEELGQDVEQESGEGNASEHDYHVSLDTDVETGAFNLPQEEALQNQMFGDYVPGEQIEYNQEREHHILEQAEGDIEEREYVSDDVQDDEGHYIVQTGGFQKVSHYIHGQIDDLEEQGPFSLENANDAQNGHTGFQ